MIADENENGMIGKLITAVAVFIGCFVVWPAAAEDNEIYIEYSGGVSYVRNQNLTGTADATTPLSGKVESDVGFNVSGAVGMRFHKFFRAELQLGYRWSEVDALSVLGEPDSGEGDFSLLTVMANGYVDYDLGIGIIPYVGAGIGWGLLDLDAKNTGNVGGILRAEGDDSVFTWAVMAGGTIPINDTVEVSIGYRYLATTDSKLTSDVDGFGSRRLDSEYDTHEGVVALRFKF